MKRQSLGFYSIPCSIGNKNIILKLDIVECDIPCLISKEAMKRGGVVIDVADDKIDIFGQKMKLNTTNSGHYILPLDDVKGGPENENQVFVVDKMLQDKDFNEKEITRIHRNLGHPSRSVMEQMLKNSECFYENTPTILTTVFAWI